ncbi:glycosyltransferase [candidate division KSB1 bacterium]
MKQKINNSIHILHIPKWYPSRIDPQFGVFIKKHIKSTSGRFLNSVVYPVKEINLHQSYETIVSFDYNIYEVIVYYKASDLSSKILSHIISAYRYTKAFIIGFQLVKKERSYPDIIHAHVLLRTGIWALIYKWIYGKPYVISEHWSGYITGAYKSKPHYYKYLLNRIIRKATVLISISESLKKAMISNGIVHPFFYNVPNIVDPPLRNQFQTVEEKKELQILTVADLVDEVKNISGIIRSLCEIKEELGSFQYHIIGDGPDRKILEKLVMDINMDKGKIIFHGKKDNNYVYQLLNEIDFLIVNSYVETFSVVTLEALVHGKPVIATSCGGPEQFINDSNGLIVSPGNQNELQDAIIMMSKNLSNYDANKIASSLSERFSSQSIGDQFENIYKQVLNIK